MKFIEIYRERKSVSEQVRESEKVLVKNMCQYKKTNGKNIQSNRNICVAICLVVSSIEKCFGKWISLKVKYCLIANRMPCNWKIKKCYSKNKSSFYGEIHFYGVYFYIETSISILHVNMCKKLMPELAARCVFILESDALYRSQIKSIRPAGCIVTFILKCCVNRLSLEKSCNPEQLFEKCDLFATDQLITIFVPHRVIESLYTTHPSIVAYLCSCVSLSVCSAI